MVRVRIIDLETVENLKYFSFTQTSEPLLFPPNRVTYTVF